MPNIDKQLNDIIAERNRRIRIIKNRPARPGDEETIARFEREKQAAQEKRQLYKQAEEGLAFLYFARRTRDMPAPIYESKEGYLEKYRKIKQVIDMQRKGVEGVGTGQFDGGDEHQ